MPLTTFRATPRAPRRAAGYALLEALIAVIVTSVGFIGAARLQTLGMSFGNTAGLRQKATLLVDQMTDRIRANQAGMTLGAYNRPTAGDTACLTAAAGCTPAQLARADMAEWSADIAAQLPGGSGIVCIDATPEDAAIGSAADPNCDGSGRVLAVKVWWTDKFGPHRFTTATRPAR